MPKEQEDIESRICEYLINYVCDRHGIRETDTDFSIFLIFHCKDFIKKDTYPEIDTLGVSKARYKSILKDLILDYIDNK